MGVPQFDPNKPFTDVGAEAPTDDFKDLLPQFDPNKPFKDVGASPGAVPPSETLVPSGQKGGKVPLPKERPVTFQDRFRQSETPAPPVQPLEDVPPPPEKDQPWAVTRGFVSGLLEQNPQMVSEALEGVSHLAPDTFRESLQNSSKEFANLAKLNPADYKMQSQGLWNIGGFRDALTWAGETLGQGVASSVPSIITGAGGGIVGGRLGGKPGAVAGGIAGATVPSAAMNYGEVYKALKDEKVDPKEAAQWAAVATGPITALDMASLGSIVGKIGLGKVKSEINHAVAKRIAKGIAEGAGTEGITEAIQEGIKDATVSLKTGKEFFTTETAKGVIEAGVGGALPGAAFGGVAGVAPKPRTSLDVGGVPVPTQEPVTPEDIEKQVKGGAIPVEPPAVGEPPGTAPPAPPVAPPDVGGPTTPIAASVPVTTTVDGVNTTTVLHGPADAYTIDTTGEKPVLVPAPAAQPVTTDLDVGEKSTVMPDGTVVDRPADVTEPAIRQFGTEAPSEPVTGMYSRLKSWVQEQGPMNATAARWISLLGKGDFRQEELRDLRLPDFLASRHERVSKEEVVDYITAMTAPMVEVTRTPLTREQRAAEEARINAQIVAVMRADPTARMPDGTPNYNHPALGPLLDEHVNINRNVKWARYEEYTTPGPRESYTELTMHVPPRKAAPVTMPQGEVVTNPGGRTHTVMIDGEMVTSFYDKGKAERTLKRELEVERKRRQDEAQRQANFVGGHYVTPNELVTIRLTVRLDENGKRTVLIEELQSDLHQKGAKLGYAAEGAVPSFPTKPPAAIPFKEGWAQLGFSRALMWAASQGITQVAWASGEEQSRRYQAGTEQEILIRRRGMEAFYDRMVTGFAKKWARRLGGTVMYTTIPGESPYTINRVDRGVYGPVWQVIDPYTGPNVPVRTFALQSQAEEFVVATTPPSARFRVLQLPGSAIETIAQGVPTYAMSVPAETIPGPGATFAAQQNVNGPTVAAIAPLKDALNALIKRLGLETKITIQLFDGTINYKEQNEQGKVVIKRWKNTYGLARQWENAQGLTHAVIYINVSMHKNAAHVWATMTHELGHIVMRSTYQNASTAVKTAVDAAYRAYKATVTPTTTFNDVVMPYQNPVAATSDPTMNNTMLFGDLSQKKQEYWAGFSEWFAEQVATWATTNAKPLSLVDKFFAGIAKQMTAILIAAKRVFKLPYVGVPELNAFLDSFVETTDQQWGHQMATQNEQEGIVKNGVQMGAEETPAPPQVETGGAGGAINSVFNGRPPKEVQETIAYADKFNWLYKWFTGIHQLAQANPLIKALQEYVETVSIAQLTKQQIMIRAQEVLKLWNKLGETQADAVSALLDEVQNMTYRTPDEVKNRVARHPTQAELLALAQKHGVTKAGLAVFGEVSKTFQEFLTRYEAVLTNEANKISDPTRQQLKLAAIAKQMAALRSKPYFPSMRFGAYTLTIRDAAKKVIHFETFETDRERRSAVASIQSKYGVSNDQVQLGKLDKTVRPLLGVPTQLLDLMQDKLNLSTTQRDALEQLKFELSPAQSFQHRFQHKKRVAGYSMDFRRAYAYYFFHGANHLMKAQYADRMRGLIKMTRQEVEDAPNITKREDIVAYMNNHLDNWLDPKSDWAAVRSLAFLWGLAFSPAAAAQNLSQTLLTTYPFLAHHFGDISAIAALANAGRRFQNFYTKGKLDLNAFETKAIHQGMSDGVIKETQAPELAGIADGNILSLGYGGNQLQRAMTKFNEMGSFLFEMAEQVNRRLVFRAALDLAMKNPQAKYVKEAVAKRQLTYQQRRDEGWSQAEAEAYCVAIDATLNTQFQYGKEFAPRVFRGKARSIFVFKTFQQSYLVFLTQNAGVTVRALLILAALGGLMGMPGAEDLEGILEAIAYRMFGKDFKLSHEVRKWILEMSTTKETGDDVAELFLHGMARKGYGIPWLMDMVGGTVGVDVPFPTFDRSKAISSGTILPVELGKLFGPPTQKPGDIIAGQVQKASGAVFGLGFSVYKALTNTQLNWNDAKRWEGMIPRAGASVSKAYRAWTEGGSRTNTGSQIVKYDVRDTEQMMEVIGMGMGYTPLRQNYEWEKALAKMDATKFWDIQREGLMRQFGNAVIGKDKEERARTLEAIRSFNKGLPPEARGKAITSDSLTKSVENRAQDRALQERGLPKREADVPIFRQEDKIYPRSMRELRKVKPAMTP